MRWKTRDYIHIRLKNDGMEHLSPFGILHAPRLRVRVSEFRSLV